MPLIEIVNNEDTNTADFCGDRTPIFLRKLK